MIRVAVFPSKRLSEALWSLANFQAAFSNLTGEDARPEMAKLQGLARKNRAP